MTELKCRPLDASTWSVFAELVERHDGIWGGCWCMSFHMEGIGPQRSPDQNRSDKEMRVREGRAHAALVFDGDRCVGWCQFGPTAELPRIKNRRAYEQGLVSLPDWRITCFFVDKGYRRRRVASLALAGALAEIAHRGGGTVESYPEDTEGRKVPGAFLHNLTVAMFEHQGFERARQIGKHRWVVTRMVAAA